MNASDANAVNTSRHRATTSGPFLVIGRNANGWHAAVCPTRADVETVTGGAKSPAIKGGWDVVPISVALAGNALLTACENFALGKKESRECEGEMLAAIDMARGEA